MTRILQGLSRSMSPEAVVEAIVAELRSTSGADHVVVARVRRPDHVVEVTLVTARANVPASRTWLRPEVPELSSDRGPNVAAPDVEHAGDRRTARPAPSRRPDDATRDSRRHRGRGDRPPRALRLWPALYAHRAARRRTPVPGRAHPVAPDPRAVGGSRASPARLGGPGGRRRLLEGVHPRGRRAGRQPRRRSPGCPTGATSTSCWPSWVRAGGTPTAWAS